MATVPLLLVFVLLVTVAAGAALVRRSPPSRETTVAAARLHATRTAVAAYALGIAAALVVVAGRLGDTGPGGLGITVLLTLLTSGVVHVVVLAVGELTWPRPQGQVRRARLVRRGPLDAAPRWLVRTTGAVVALAVCTLAGGTLRAAENGRSVTVVSGDGLVSGTASPFPGSFYAGPTAIGLLVLALVAAGALWIVADRPAVVTEDERVEAALRRASAHRVLRAAAGVTSSTTGGLAFVGGNALRSAADGSVGAAWLGYVGLAVMLLGLLAMLAGAALTCVRAPGVPAGSPVAPVA
jgi:hypothetical protein